MAERPPVKRNGAGSSPALLARFFCYLFNGTVLNSAPFLKKVAPGSLANLVRFSISVSADVLISGLALLTVGNGGKGMLPWHFAESSDTVDPGKFGLRRPRLCRG